MDGVSQIQIIPAVDVLEGRVVRLLEGDYERSTSYAADPVEAAQRWVEDGAPLVHVVDLDGARRGATDLDLWTRLGEAGVPFQAGGGVRSAQAAAAVLDAGAQRVVMGTVAVHRPEILADVGADVVAAVDVRDGRATGEGWREEGRSLATVLDGLAAVGVERLLVTGIARDGTMRGPDTGLTREVIGDGRFSVIASGGVGSLTDLAPLARMGCEGVVVGRALYEGRFTLREARRAAGTIR